MRRRSHVEGRGSYEGLVLVWGLGFWFLLKTNINHERNLSTHEVPSRYYLICGGSLSSSFALPAPPFARSRSSTGTADRLSQPDKSIISSFGS